MATIIKDLNPNKAINFLYHATLTNENDFKIASLFTQIVEAFHIYPSSFYKYRQIIIHKINNDPYLPKYCMTALSASAISGFTTAGVGLKLVVLKLPIFNCTV